MAVSFIKKYSKSNAKDKKLLKTVKDIPSKVKNTKSDDVLKTVKSSGSIIKIKSGQVISDTEEEGQALVSVPEKSAIVSVGLGATVNIGNFNSVKLSVGLSVPCIPESTDEVYESVSEWVGEKLEKLHGQYIEEG